MSMNLNKDKTSIKILIPNSEAAISAQLKNIKDSTVAGYYTNDNVHLKQEIVEFLSNDLNYILDITDTVQMLEILYNDVYENFKSLYKDNMADLNNIYEYFKLVEGEYLSIPRMFFSGVSERYFKFNNDDPVVKKLRSILYGDITGFEILKTTENYVIKPFLKGDWKMILENKKEKIDLQIIDDSTYDYPDIFISYEYINKIFDVLKRKKNIILQGSPGVGKTFIATNLLDTDSDYELPEIVQFHQSLSYEDFVQGYRPKEDGGFELKNGIFYNLVKKAVANKDKKYCIIIDEINRGNLSKIFGELMLLIEGDKRNEKYAVNLTYSNGQEKFYIPENIYIIGTMNTADKSLSMVDYALRRRFAFIDIYPGFNNSKFKDYLVNREEISEEFVIKLVEKLTILNKIIDESLGQGFQIGHSYFVGTLNKDKLLDSYKQIIEYEIKPLLEEYWFDDDSKVEDALNILAM